MFQLFRVQKQLLAPMTSPDFSFRFARPKSFQLQLAERIVTISPQTILALRGESGMGKTSSIVDVLNNPCILSEGFDVFFDLTR